MTLLIEGEGAGGVFKRSIAVAFLAGAVTVLVPSAVGSSPASSSRPQLFHATNWLAVHQPYDNPSVLPREYIGLTSRPALRPEHCRFGEQPGLQAHNPERVRPLADAGRHRRNLELPAASDVWFGMVLCDDQSAPNPTGSTLAGPNVPCTARATRTSSPAPRLAVPATSASIPAPHSWRCSSTHPAGPTPSRTPATPPGGARR